MNRFLAVERQAAQELISGRLLQSVEFDNGRTLSELLKNPSLEAEPTAAVQIVRSEDGLFFLPTAEPSNDFLVFDLETSGSLDHNHIRMRSSASRRS